MRPLDRHPGNQDIHQYHNSPRKAILLIHHMDNRECRLMLGILATRVIQGILAIHHPMEDIQGILAMRIHLTAGNLCNSRRMATV